MMIRNPKLECQVCDGATAPGLDWHNCPGCGRYRHIKPGFSELASAEAHHFPLTEPQAETSQAQTWLHLDSLACQLGLTLGRCGKCMRQIERGSLCISCRLNLLCYQIYHCPK